MWKHSLAHLYFLIFLKFISCCQCNINQTNLTDLNIEKRELEELSTTELVDNTTDTTTTDTTVTIRERSSELNETTTETSSELYESNTELSDNSAEINETSMEATELSVDFSESVTTGNETTTEYVEKRKSKQIKHFHKDLVKNCNHYKKGNAFDLSKMADVWQVVYYQLPNRLKCFKLHIKLLKAKEQQRYAQVYGNFNDTVHWERVYLEIKSSEKSEGGARRHFLQGTQSDKGVMENIIIDEEHCQNTTYLTLHRESGDQWLVIKNLLVMRDCDTGDLVVFTKVPLQPRRDDILDALMIFGENKPNGTMACEEKTDKSWLKYEETVISDPL